MARKNKSAPPPGDGDLPTRDQVLDFIRDAPSKVGKREIARAFGIKGGARIALKKLLADMAEEGLIAGDRKALRSKGGLPPVAVLEVKARDDDGDLVAEPVVWDESDGPRPGVLLLTAHRGRRDAGAEIGIGDRVLARITELSGVDVEGFRFEAEPIRRLPRDQRRLLGIFRSSPRGGGTIEPIDRKSLRSWTIQKADQGGAKDGDLVRFDLAKRGRFTTPQAAILETLGNPDDQRQISLIAVHAHGLPDDFPESVIAETRDLKPPRRDGRLDLTGMALLTIDPADARDHDDAVHAAPDTAANNPGGFVVHVAIADVAHYVRPGSRLDREARLRGNSVYFPDRVVPMLPEKISNDLCSLREGEDRPCLVVRMIFGADGEKRSHTFHRAMMRSAAKLSYQEAQAAFDGAPGEAAEPLMDGALLPLWAAYQAVAAARDKRGPLDLDLPEKKIRLGPDGRVADVVIPERLAAHRLIEEFMIQANVAAAETLEARRTPVVYRAHAEPSKEKLKSLREFLETMDLKLPTDGSLKPAAFNRVLERAKAMPVPELVNEVVLRSQAQAEYTIENYGHFGLNLRRYAHFTSPIRRYADLLVHRALIRALGFGDDGLADDEFGGLADTARLISEAERRAMAAERETVDRLIANHLADRVGATFNGRIAGVTRSGLFVKLDQTGADGFVPISSLEGDFYHHIEEAHALLGARSGGAYRLGDKVEVRLVEAIPSAGALRFEMLTPPAKGALTAFKGGLKLRQRRGRPMPGGQRATRRR
ncbi:MAG: ribonuclease R [Hyphomicrobiaceae bacterium]|nr:ribonuclease R [Hyphomicrobiaceae bacterium]